VNHEVRRKDKASSNSTKTEVLTVRRIGSSHQKSKGDVGKSKTDNNELRKNQCVFCKEKRNWKIDCQRLKKGPKSKANIAHADDGTALTLQCFLSITPSVCYSKVSA